MYAKIGDLEVLPNYLTDVVIGDILVVQALVLNPVDWQHFYDRISTKKKGDKIDFVVLTREGDRLAGTGSVLEVEKWTSSLRYGFKIKINVTKQKSLSNRRSKLKHSWEKPVIDSNLISPRISH
jgi:hypothetical protein